MTISSTYTFNLTGTEFINAALRKLSVISDGQSASTTQSSNALQALNAMLKGFMTKGMPLWVITEYTLTMTAARTYTFGVGQTINVPSPLKVTQIIRQNITAGTRVPLIERSHYDYNLLSSSTNTGVPTTYWYEPLNQVGVLHLWPTPDTTTIAGEQLIVVYQKPFADMTSGSDTVDVPQWWHEAIIYGLAQRLSSEYGLSPQDRELISKEAEYFLNEALSFGTEDGSLFFMPNWTSNG